MLVWGQIHDEMKSIHKHHKGMKWARKMQKNNKKRFDLRYTRRFWKELDVFRIWIFPFQMKRLFWWRMEEESKTLFVHVYTQISRLILLLKSHALHKKKKRRWKKKAWKRFLVFAYHLQYHWEFELNAYQLTYLHI